MWLKLIMPMMVSIIFLVKLPKIFLGFILLISVIYGNRIYRMLIFTSVALPGYFEYKIEQKKKNPNFERLHKKYAPKTVKMVSKLEGIYYKVAQVFGSRADVVPIIFQKALEPFLDDVKPKTWDQIKQNNTTRNININKKAIAAASIGQVHLGYQEDKKVVIKILYPNIEKKTKLDLWAIKFWIKHALPGIKPQIDSFSDCILGEFDFRQEAHIQKIIRNHFIKSNINVLIPNVIGHASRTDIAMEYMEGISLLDYLKQNPLQIDSMVVLVYQVCIDQIINLGYFTTDPHPGNFLVSPNNELIMLDFGQHAFLKPSRIILLKELWYLLAQSNKKQNEIASKLEEMGYITKKSNVKFLNYFAEALFDTHSTSEEDSINEFNKEMGSDEFISTPSDFTMVSKVVTSLRGLSSLFGLKDLSISKIQKSMY